MTYDDIKEHNGRKYSGMAVGGRHNWDYPDGRWEEEKVAPERWRFSFTSIKRRNEPAPEGSGCPVNTEFHWYILADQRVRKIDADCYQTLMNGLKFKVGHRRPHWRRMSYGYADNEPYRERVAGILRNTLEEMGCASSVTNGSRHSDRSSPGPITVPFRIT
jgi:hypothetical protein